MNKPESQHTAGKSVLTQASEQEVDVSLIDEMLRLSPLERLRHNDRMVETVIRLRAAFALQRKLCADQQGEDRT